MGKTSKRESGADAAEEEAFFREMCVLYRQEAAAHGVTMAGFPEGNPELLKGESPAEFRAAMREGVNDFLEQFQDAEGAKLAEIDRFLTERGAPSLTAMRLRRRSGIRRLLKRGQLTSDVEYRAVMAILNDVSDSNPWEREREKLNRLVSEYQDRRRNQA
jgi:hypothetical protein